MAAPRLERQKSRGVSIWILILSNILVFQLSGWYFNDAYPAYQLSEEKESSAALPAPQGSFTNPLEIPRGQAVALPSVRLEGASQEVKRSQYGGKGDKPHLGGFLTDGIDMEGVTPALWKFMVEKMGIKSLLDVGCGRGISSSWFLTHGIETLCVEGSHDAVEQSILPADIVTEHDFSRGPWWPPRTVDAIWCVELLEHIGRNFHKNLLPAFRKAAVIYATHSTWDGWHHVEVHMEDWWINKFQSYGFEYSQRLTDEARQVARLDRETQAPNGERYHGQHVWLHVMVR
jgi:hypothetical protein